MTFSAAYPSANIVEELSASVTSGIARMYQFKHVVLPGLITLVLGLLAIYWPAFNGPFLPDDQQNLISTKIDQLNLTSLWAVATGNNSGLLGDHCLL